MNSGFLKKNNIYRWVVLSLLPILGSFSVLILPFTGATVGLLTVQPVRAETKQIELTVEAQGDQNFNNLVRKAEALMLDAIQQAFIKDSTITQVSVKVLGERNGQASPLLFLQVSRTDWQKQPDLQSWTKYFDGARFLLGFSKLESTVAARSSGVSSAAIRAPGQGQEGDPGFRDD